MKDKRKPLIMIFILLFIGMMFAASWAAEKLKGKLYLVEQQQTLTRRAGIPCMERPGDYCHLNYRCQPGQVARGLVMNLDASKGDSQPTGFGLICSDPNELYKSEEIGAFGENFSGNVYRDPCDVGFFLVGAEFYTTDRKTISGIKTICRRYWPVEERKGTSTFGYGDEMAPIACRSGKFVNGVKVSHWRKRTEGQPDETGLYSVMFYCAEMREHLKEPDKKKDPRDR